MFTKEQVLAASLDYFCGDSLAAEVFVEKYALRDDEGVFYELTPRDMHRRLAREFARMEQKWDNPLDEETIFQFLEDWSIVAQGSPMSGIGNPFQIQSLSNCFVISSPSDSYGGIFRADEEMAQIMKRRGGVGGDITLIRPKGLPTTNAARTTDGIGVFMQRFSNTTREVAQGGRRGALMLSILVHHPEILTFINIKKDRKKVTGANVSVRATDEFMRAVRDDKDVELRWPPENPKIRIEVRANDIWDAMMGAAHDSAEPGILFWDTIINGSPADCYAKYGFRTLSTNPCGELPLPPYDSCRLILMNLMRFVLNPYTKDAKFDYKRFHEAVVIAQRLMDDLVELELEMIDKIIAKVDSDPEDEEEKFREKNLWRKIKKVTAQGRRTGLGITALGDTLASLGIKYGTDESIQVTEEIYKALAVGSYTSSVRMAMERGAFPIFEKELEENHPFVKRVIESCDKETQLRYIFYGRRNIANLTTPPAGTTSIECLLVPEIYGTTSGGEPCIYLDYTRRRKVNKDKGDKVDYVDPSGDCWQEYKVYHPGHKAWMKINNKTDADVKESPYYGATASEIDWIKKVEMQAAAQRWVDHSISNTTNIPQDTPVEVVKQIYMKGWELGCKGITIYREGSRTGVLVKDSSNGKQGRESESIQENHAPKRPAELPCDIHRAKVKGQQYMILIGLLNGKPYEVFCGLAENMEIGKSEKTGKIVKNSHGNGLATYDLVVGEEVFKDVVNLFDNPSYGAFTRTISTALRHGVPVHYLVEQLRKDKHSDFTSFSSVIARVFSKSYIADGTKSLGEKVCPDCKSDNLSYQQGCVTCMNCGSSKCS